MDKVKFLLMYRPFGSFEKCSFKIKGGNLNGFISHSVVYQKSINQIGDVAIVDLLKKLSLVGQINKEKFETLQSAVLFADQILHIRVSNNMLITTLGDMSGGKPS